MVDSYVTAVSIILSWISIIFHVFIYECFIFHHIYVDQSEDQKGAV